MSSRQLDEETIFHTARLIDNAEARDRYLEQICADDQPLRERVEALLAVHEQERQFLNSTPDEPAPTIDQSPLTERPGSTIGRYRLMEQVGEGGMGVVFVAEQERPVQRKVALKIIKPGMDTKEVVARFEAERQALALMDHPNIAKVLDAGSTDSGRPYFVMELVRGIPITEYCDQAKLSIRERLELFIEVCQAIQHAHQKGIIHRDVKPSNVLVTLHDSKPVPKVIDFGVAKATNQRLTEQTIYTRLAQIIGTPMYMSPEQAELSGLDVDTRSDVYSLGVLLYELLTGTTPFDKQRFEKAAYDEIRRIVREEEPPKPSTKISTLGARAASVSSERRTEARKLHQLVRGDLDWIVMKALEKDRNRRYETAISFAMDIQRHLSHEPVIARPPTTTYRARKLLYRNRTLATACALAASTLLLGATMAIIGWHRARLAEKTALEAKRDAEYSLAMLVETLGVTPDDQSEAAVTFSFKGPQCTLKELLDDLSKRLERQSDCPASVEAQLQGVLGKVYFHLGMQTECSKHFRRALQLRHQLYGRVSDEAAATLLWLGIVFQWEDPARGEEYLRESIRIYELLGRDTMADKIASAMHALGACLRNQGRIDEAIVVGTEAVVMHRRFQVTWLQKNQFAWSLVHLAHSHLEKGNRETAQRLASEARLAFKGTNDPYSEQTTLGLLARTLYEQGKVAQAIDVGEERVAIAEGVPDGGISLEQAKSHLAVLRRELEKSRVKPQSK